MHCAEAFLLIKFMFCLLLSLYPWTPRSIRLTTLSIAFNFFPTSLLSFLSSLTLSIISALKEVTASFLLGPVELWDCPWASPPDLQAAASSWEMQWAGAILGTLWSGSPEFYCGRYNGVLRHKHDYTVFPYFKCPGHKYCCSATWNCVSLLASLNFKNIFPCQLK